jgi:hypothetical protein
MFQEWVFPTYNISTEDSDKIQKLFWGITVLPLIILKWTDEMAGIYLLQQRKNAWVFRLLVLLIEGETAGET